MKKLRERNGLSGWLIALFLLICAGLVCVLVAVSVQDRSLEYDRAVKFVTSNITVDTLGSVPKVETEFIKDYGEHVFIAARYKIEVEGKPTVSGSYLLDISDSSQQVYNVSEEFEYDYDYKSAAHRFALDWAVR